MMLVKEDATIAVSLKVEHRWFFQSDELISLHFLGETVVFKTGAFNRSATSPLQKAFVFQ